MEGLITRAQWRARAPKNRYTRTMGAPSSGHWNGPTVVVSGRSEFDHSHCAVLVRGVQNFHMDGRGWLDIAYNFVICQHGYIFEGRGLSVENGANGTNQANRTSHAIMWLSGENNRFTDAEKAAYRRCVQYISERTPAPNRSVAHRDHKSTQCPGDERYGWIRSGMPVVNSSSPTPSAPKNPTLSVGMRGEAVRRVQTIISQKAGGDIVVDGVFGSGTKRRVRDVQNLFGLTPDGVVGPKTWDALRYLEAMKPPAPAPAPRPNPSGPVRPTLRRGMKNDHVTFLQRVIHRRAGGNISVDGDFGPQTERRVKDVQTVFALDPDGIVGPRTWEAIDYLNAT